MPIIHLTAHRIEKPGPTAKTLVKLNDAEIPLTGLGDEFARELRQTFIKKMGKVFGRFSDESSNLLAPWLKEFTEEKMGFSSLTQRITSHFAQLLDATENFAYGYLVFTVEKLEAAGVFSIFWLETIGAQFFDGDLSLSATQILDGSGLNLAAKINLTEWQDDASKSYLGVLPRRGDKPFSDVFVELVGFTDKRDVKTETEQFLGAVDSFVIDLPEELAVETRSRVIDYCLDQDKNGEEVSMDGLSHFVSEENPQQFKKYLAKECPQLEHSLIPDKTQLRNYMRISGRNELMSMSFASDCLGQTVIYDAQNDSLIIKNIPSSLKSRLQKHMSSRRSE